MGVGNPVADAFAVAAAIDVVAGGVADGGEFSEEEMAELERLEALGEEAVVELAKRSKDEEAWAAGYDGRKKHLEAEAKSMGFYASVRRRRAGKYEAVAMQVMRRLGLQKVRHPDVGTIRLQRSGTPAIEYLGVGEIPDEYAKVEIVEKRTKDRKAILEAFEAGVLDRDEWSVEYSEGLRYYS